MAPSNSARVLATEIMSHIPIVLYSVAAPRIEPTYLRFVDPVVAK